MGRRRWEGGQGVSVEVDGSTMPDPNESAQLPLLVVTVRLPGFRAHSLAHALLDHHCIGEITEAGGPWAVDWRELANGLHEAAEAARTGARRGAKGRSRLRTCRKLHVVLRLP